MPNSSLLLLSLATFLSFLFPPLVKASTEAGYIDRQFYFFPIVLFGLTVLHGLALFFGLLNASAGGALDAVFPWSNFRRETLFAVVVLFEVLAFNQHRHAMYFSVHHAQFTGFEMAAVFLPALLVLCGVAAVTMGRLGPTLPVIALSLAVVITAGGQIAAGRLETENLERGAELDNIENQRIASRLAELAATPDSVPALLDFLRPSESKAVRTEAGARVAAIDGALEQIEASGRANQIDTDFFHNFKITIAAQRQRAELAAVPAGASIDKLLALYDSHNRRHISEEIETRIIQLPNAANLLHGALHGPHTLQALILFSRIPKTGVDKRLLEDAYIASADLAIEYCRRIDKGDKPSLHELAALSDAAGGLLNNIDTTKPEIEKAIKIRSTFNPSYH